jgi:sulfoxide reductase heme-binding subunit YedZ
VIVLGSPDSTSAGVFPSRPVLTSVVGMILWWLFVEQWWLGVDWPTVRSWQSQFVYKVTTGAGLGFFIAFQWLFAVCRMSGATRAAKALYPWHQTVGALAPALLFLHSTRLGFGYLVFLTGVYLANNLLGLVSPSAFHRLKPFLAAWTVAHVALSVLVVALTGYHAWTALYYE